MLVENVMGNNIHFSTESLCMYVYFDSVVHYTSYVNNVRQIKQIQIHPEPRPTPESLEDCGWVLSKSGWPKVANMASGMFSVQWRLKLKKAFMAYLP